MRKATPALKYHLPQPPNLTDPMEVLETPVESLQNGDEELTDVNNVEVSEKLMPFSSETRLRPFRRPKECDAKRLGESEGNGGDAS